MQMLRIRRDSPLWAAARVAAVATLIAALLYAAAAVGVTALLVGSLFQQVDDQLAAELHFLQQRPQVALARADGRRTPEVGPLTTTTWVVTPDDQLLSPPSGPVLPARYKHLDSTTSTTIEGHRFRLAGGPLVDGWLVVGVQTDALDSAIQALILRVAIAALALGIPILLVVFLASLAIGRWSAAPIDRARRRVLDFTADASHELRTPLQVIEAEVSLALLRERDAASYRDTIENVGRESGRLRRLVDDLLWLARFDSRPGQPQSELVDVGAVAADALERFRAPAERKRQRLQLQPTAPGQALVLAPPEWIDRLLGVLLDNAHRYTPEGGTVRVAVEAQDGHVGLRVEDSGPGIPPSERQRIFERFHRGQAGDGGSGLGLSIANAVVSATRGRWRVGDSPEGGASMAVSWPLARGTRGDARAGARSAQPQTTEGPVRAAGGTSEG